MGGAPSKAEPRAARIEKGFAELIAADYENLQQQVTRQYAQLECNETTDAQVLELCQRYKQRYSIASQLRLGPSSARSVPNTSVTKVPEP